MIIHRLTVIGFLGLVWFSDFSKQPKVPVLKQVQNQRIRGLPVPVSSQKNIKELTGFGGKNQKRTGG
jgi:hypothetical protein